MHAFLLVGENKEELLAKISELSEYTDNFTFEVTKIEEVRNLIKLSSVLNKHTIIIEGLNKASTEAQNAFLKTLEEPPGKIQFILTVPNLNNLLPTIISRCTQIKLTGTNVHVANPEVNSFLSGKLAEKFKQVQGMQRSEAVEFVEKIARHLHNGLQASPNKKLNSELLKKTLFVHKLLVANVNPNLALTALAIGVYKTQNSMLK